MNVPEQPQRDVAPEQGELGGRGPHPLSPLPPSNPDRAHPGTGHTRTPAVELQDLSSDKLLLAAPRVTYQGRAVPSLGGIPLLARLGRGGMGAVYLGMHPRLHSEVAVKVLPFHLAEQQPEMIGRFQREAQIAARVNSPHVVAVLDLNQDQGLFFLVMEFVEGMSAGALLKHAKQTGGIGLSETAALDICVAATEGLAAAHAIGIIHRDVKPDNIMIPKARLGGGLELNAAKLADLGLARAELLGQSMTKSDAALGTPGFMAPEQGVSAKKAGKPADVFAMGATLYALLSGHAPFEGESGIEVLLKTLQQPYAPIRLARADVSLITSALIDRCLQKEPQQRYADGNALLQALKVCRQNISQPETAQRNAIEQLTVLGKAAEVGLPALESDAGTARQATPAPTTMPRAGASRFRKRFVVAAVATLLITAAGFLAALHFRESARAATLAAFVRLGQAASMQDGQPLADSISSLREFREKNAARPAAEMQELDATLASLLARQKRLQERKNLFEQTLARAEAASDSDSALQALSDAERIGTADSAEILPDLLAGLTPSLQQRRQKVQDAKISATADRLKKERERAEQDAFTASFQKAKDAADKGQWDNVETSLKSTLTALGNAEHPSRTAAQQLLSKATSEIELRRNFDAKMKAAEELLVTDPAAAKTAFQEAKAAWPATPDSARVEKGMQAADAALEQKRYEAALKEAQAHLLGKRAAEAEAGFRAVLALRKDDAPAQRGLEDAQYMSALDKAEKLLTEKQWAAAKTAFSELLALRKGDKAADDGLAKADAGALDEKYQNAIKRGSDSLQAEDWKSAGDAFAEALTHKKDDPVAKSLLDQARRKASDKRYADALGDGRKAIAAAQWPSAKDALQRALQERADDAQATALLAQVAEATKPKPLPPPLVPPPEKPAPKPAEPAVAKPAFGPEKSYGPFGVYANRIQGVPLDKNGAVVPVRGDLDNEQYAEALAARKSWLKISAGAKVRIEAEGKWFSGPTGAWVTPDGKHEDGREALKSFRAFSGPGNSYNIAMLVVYFCEKDKPATADYAQISNAGNVWAFNGKPIEFVAPASGTLRLQQNRDGYFDVTQGALSVTVIVSEPSPK
ncbi:MAG TPA: protein kinase [Planctomycetota bacterium]|jgi:serine/threonine-protein kinase